MAAKAVTIIQVEDVPATDQLAGAIDQANGGLYVSSGSTVRFVALPLKDFEQMQRQQQRLVLREQYIRSLIQAGYSSIELQTLLPGFDAADAAWLENHDSARAQMIEASQAAFGLYCREQGVAYETMTEDEIDRVTDALVRLAQGRSDDAPHRF